LAKVTAPETAVNNFSACRREIVCFCLSFATVKIPPTKTIPSVCMYDSLIKEVNVKLLNLQIGQIE
jgi:hypothetical protein